MSLVSKSSSRILKVILLGLFAYLIYNQIFKKEELGDIVDLFKSNFQGSNILYLGYCLLLMPLNWLFEALKWRTLVNDFEKISIGRAYQAILAGLSVGIVTPQRIGEYGGRVLVLSTENRIKGVLATFLCSLFQNLVNVLLGLIGIYFLNAQLGIIDEYWVILLVVLAVLGFAVLYFLYRNTSYVKRFLERIRISDKIKNWIFKLSYFKQISNYKHFLLFMFSIARYATYLLQYLFILWFFGIGVDVMQGFTGISSIYLIQSGIPLPPLLDIAARAEIAYLVWGHYSQNVIGILSATFGLWAINLIIPSFFGLFYVFKADIFNSVETK